MHDNNEIEAKYVQIYKAWCDQDTPQHTALALEMECERTKALTNIVHFLERIAAALERNT